MDLEDSIVLRRHSYKNFYCSIISNNEGPKHPKCPLTKSCIYCVTQQSHSRAFIRDTNVSPHKNLHTNVHSSFIYIISIDG